MTEENRDNGRYNSVNKAWSKNWLVPVLLLMLRQWSSYGYALMEKMSTFGVAAMNPGTFYRTLRQMEKDGMVSSSWDTSEGGPARRVYSITDAGESYLHYRAQSLESISEDDGDVLPALHWPTLTEGKRIRCSQGGRSI